MGADGSNRRQLGDSAMSNEDPRWTADGQRVVFMQVPLLARLPDEAPRDFIGRRTAAQQWFSVTLDGLDARALTPEELARVVRDRRLSPNGQWMVHARQVAGVTGLYLQELPSGRERLLDQGSSTRSTGLHFPLEPGSSAR
jgi:Tol biopolymer transport system component